MPKLVISNMSFHYAQYYNAVFENVNLDLDTNWKLGLIGRNGRGKTTFLKLLTGELQPTKGLIRSDVNIQYFPYEINNNYTNTLDVVKENIARLKSMEIEMDKIIASQDQSRFNEYQNILEQYQSVDGFNMEMRIRREMNYMHLKESLLERDYNTLSGGEKTKIQIIILFLRLESYVLLDEPTNHLDIGGKKILADYLKQKEGFMVVSHDRDFVDLIADHILSINKTDIALERGNYSSWKANKDKKEAFEFRTRARLEKEIENLEKQALSKREWAGVAERTKNQHGKFERSSGSRAAQFMMHAKNAEKNARQNIDEKNNLLLNYEKAHELTIQQETIEYEELITVSDLSFGYGEKLLFENLAFQVNKGDRIWVKGKNGCGKSTLLNLITEKYYIERKIYSSVVNYCPEINYCPDIKIAQIYQEPLWTNGVVRTHIGENIEWAQMKELCSYFDIDEATLSRPVETYSDGELRKIEIARALCSEYHVIIMDEPLNYMDVYFREQLEKAILEYQPTMIFVEHDERFGRNIATKVIEIGEYL